MFNNLKVGTRLTIILILMVVAMLIMGGAALHDMLGARFSMDSVYQGGVTKVATLSDIRNQIASKLVEPVQKISDGTLSWNEGSAAVREAQESIPSLWNKYVNGNSYLSEDLLAQQRSIVMQLQSSMRNLDAAFVRIQNLMDQKDEARLKTYVTKDLYLTTDPIVKSLNQLITLHMNNSQREYEDTRSTSSWVEEIITLLAILISIPLTIAIIRSIVHPLNYAMENVDRVAVGDVDSDVQIISGGELGRLLEAVRNMNQSTNKMSSILATIASGNLTVEALPRSEKDALGHALKDMLSQMRVMIGEIKNEVIRLTVSSEEITASLSPLSLGANETTAAVTETTSTLEELKQTSLVSVEKAKEVLANAEGTLQTVMTSEKSVVATIEDMNQIHDRMQVISDSILKLSEKGLAISDIMDTVNDIAEQSNLLAVNAAIEAAKAGEMGRGFSVVAQEIRKLAEQSREATVQVRALLSEIQNATNAAVLATEQGTKAVEKGVHQSTDTNNAMKELAAKMAKVTQAAEQIVSSNEQQLIGTKQITTAMTNIREATSDHITQLKQMETAIGALNEVGSTLKELISKYTLPSSTQDLAMSLRSTIERAPKARESITKSHEKIRTH